MSHLSTARRNGSPSSINWNDWVFLLSFKKSMGCVVYRSDGSYASFEIHISAFEDAQLSPESLKAHITLKVGDAHLGEYVPIEKLGFALSIHDSELVGA